MPSLVTASQRPRRTQAQRRAATREAVLDAAIACLSEEGYASTTTRRIAERAGVTPGALQHHFATKAQLLGDARRRLGVELAKALLEHSPQKLPSPQVRTEALLDRWWEFLKGPLFAALVELWVAARTDEELRAELREAEREGARLSASLNRSLYPETVDHPDFARLLATGRATMRGLAMARFLDSEGADEAWVVVREQLLESARRLQEEALRSR